MMSTTVAELGAVYCSIVSFANTREHPEVSRVEITQSLVAIRLKLKRSIVLKTNIVYEASCIFFLHYHIRHSIDDNPQFSLRGKWPCERYQKILELQLWVPIYILGSACSNTQLYRKANI